MRTTKGFAITGIIYGMFLLFIVILIGNLTTDLMINRLNKGEAEAGMAALNCEVWNVRQLDNMRRQLCDEYILMRDLTVPANWIPIGTTQDPFRKSFRSVDGETHTITFQGAQQGGLFGIVRNVDLENRSRYTWIRDININSSIEGNSSTVGLLAGTVRGNVEIKNITVLGTLAGASNVGGLVGGVSRYEHRDMDSPTCVIVCDNINNPTPQQQQECLAAGEGEIDRQTCPYTWFVPRIDNVVSNVNVSATGIAGGLFGISSGTVSNAIAKGSVTSTGNTVGGFAGQVGGGNITNAFSSGNVTGNNIVGGFAGQVGGGNITNVCATGDVTVTIQPNPNVVLGVMAGGFAGATGGTIEASCATGSVTGHGSVITLTSRASLRGTGGFVGYNAATIRNSFATGAVEMLSGSDIGGFAGQTMGSTIQNSFSRSIITTPNSSSRVGGFIGTTNSVSAVNTTPTTHLTNVYHAGSMSGTLTNDRRPGVHTWEWNRGTATGSFFNSDINGVFTTDARFSPLTSAQMRTQSSFTGWNFTNIWMMPPNNSVNDGFPCLRGVGTIIINGETVLDFGCNP